MPGNENTYKKYIILLLGGLVLFGLFFTKYQSYILFHSLAEIFSIAIGFGIFIVAWNTKRFQENNYFLFIGIGYLFVSLIDLFHTFAFKGMGIFNVPTNLATQLWIAARYLEGITLLLAPIALTAKGRRLNAAPLFSIYVLATALIFLSIFYWKNFPAAFVDGSGLTTFKIASEYIISAMLAVSLYFLYKRKGDFEKPAFYMIGSSVIVTILSEMSFTLYTDPYQFTNMLGHYFKIVSFYLIYRAVIVTGLTDPYNFLFRNTKKSEEILQTALGESKRRQEEMQALLDSTQAILAFKDFKEAAQAIFNSCKNLIGAEGGCLAILDEKGEENEIFVSESKCHLCSLSGEPAAELNELRAQIYKTGKAIYNNGLDISSPADSNDNGCQEFENVLFAPLFHSQKTAGLLSFTNKPGGFLESDAKIAVTFGRLISIALANHLAEEKILKLKLGIERSSEAVFITDKDGDIIYVNPTFEKLYGYKKSEVLGQNPRLLKSGAHQKEIYEDFWNTLLSKRSVNRELINKTKDGRHICVEASANPILGENGELLGFLAIQKDITERKNIEEALKKSEQKYREIVETAREGIWILDPDQKIIYANQRLAEILGYEVDEIIGKNKAGFSPEKEFFPAEERRKRGTREKPMLKKDGKQFWVLESVSRLFDERGNDVGALEMITDITMRKMAEEKLKSYTMHIEREKAEDEALLSSIGDGIVAIDSLGKVLFTNKAFGDIIGLAAEEIKNKNLADIVYLEDHRGNFIPVQYRPSMLAITEGKKVTFGTANMPYWYIKDSQTKIPLAITAAPIILENKIIGAVAVWRDITKEKEVDKAKTEFVSLASHQLRTPLSSISLSSEMLLGGIAGDMTKEQKKFLRTIFSSTKEMTELIEALLNVSRIEMGTLIINPEPTNLTALTDDVLKKFTIQAKNKKLKLKKRYESNLPDINIDQKLMRLILDNLISNAVKYTRPKDTIEIELAKKNPDVLIRVADTGCGIPKRQHSEVFKKLFRADNELKSETKGTGLGLYMVKSAVEQYGGKIWFESEEHKGTVFYVTVPLSGMKIKTAK